MVSTNPAKILVWKQRRKDLKDNHQAARGRWSCFHFVWGQPGSGMWRGPRNWSQIYQTPELLLKMLVGSTWFSVLTEDRAVSSTLCLEIRSNRRPDIPPPLWFYLEMKANSSLQLFYHGRCTVGVDLHS